MSTKDLAGVYYAKNLVNGKVYVGSARKVLARMITHRRSLKYRKHINRHLQSSWDKHGPDNFEWGILERVQDPTDKETRLEREQHWIIALKASDPNHGYNLIHSVRSFTPSPVRSKLSKEIWSRPGLKEAVSLESQKRWDDPAYRAKMTQVSLEQWQDPGRMERHKGRLAKRWSDPVNVAELQKRNETRWSKPEELKNYSEKIKAKWADPEYREKQRLVLIERWKNPAYRAKRRATFAARRALKQQTRNEIV
jgi:group I intron endonuclease